MIGYEEQNLYFLDGDSTLIVYNNSLNYVRTDEFRFDGALYGSTLGDLVDGNIPGAYYVGWTLGPIVAFVHQDYGGNPVVPNNDYAWTHTARWMEDARKNDGPKTYRQDPTGYYDTRPHQQLWSMFPDAVTGDGNNQATSEDLWAELLQSDYLIGNSSSLVRAHDTIEDWHFNFIDPDDSSWSYYFYTYTDFSSLRLSRSSFPLTLVNGVNAGESLLNNDRLLAVGDDNTLWLDNDGTLSIYGYPGASVRVDQTQQQFTQGPADWLGAYLVDKLQYFIGYEETRLYFLEGDSTLHVFDYNFNYLRTDEIVLDGDLAGITLGDIVDHQVPGVTYAGWNHGPTIVMVDTSAPSAPDHFELSYPSNALTCGPQSVTVKACADASCSTLFTDSVSVTLSPTGWSGGNTISFTGGMTTAELYHTTAETVTLSVSSATPAKSGGSDLCRIDGGAATAFCDLTFADSGLFFDVPDFVANRGAGPVTVRALKTDETQQCVPGFASVDKDIQLWSDYVTPDETGRVASRAVLVNGVAIGNDLASATTQTLSFDALGETTITVNYTDAGQMQVNLLHTGSGDTAGLTLTGADQFISRPAGLCVQPASTCTLGSLCPAFVAAGDAFDIDVRAVAWQVDSDGNLCDNPISTPSYSASSVALSGNLLAPAGGVNGLVTPTTYSHLADASATQTLSATQSEVGVFSFTVTPPDYMGYSLGSFTSAPVGRFYPHHFDAGVVNQGELSSTCNAGSGEFIYNGQTTYWETSPVLSITALNANGAVTQNYTHAGFRKLLAADVSSALSGPVADNVTLGTNGVPLPVTSVLYEGTLSVISPGNMLYTLNVLDEITYDRTTSAQVAPFNPDISLTLAVFSDADGSPLNYAVSATPSASAEMLFGRLWLEDTYGPETRDLFMPLRVEYYDGSRYRTNSNDSCSAWNSSNASATPSSLTSVGVSSGTLIQGSSEYDGILLLAPTSVVGSPDSGEADVSYTAPVWLQGDYDGNGSFENPQGTATFGVFRGHHRKIYQKEVH